MSNNFSTRYKLIYRKYADIIEKMGGKPSESGLARFLGVSQTATQRWKNYQLPDPESMKSIHDKLGFSYDWLITGEGEPMDATQERINSLERELELLRTRKVANETSGKADANEIAKAAGQE